MFLKPAMSTEQKQEETAAATKKEDPNKKIFRIWKEKGEEAAVSAMFQHPETEKSLTYAEMRMFYG